MQKLNFPVYSRIPVFRGFPENYNETPLSEGAIHNFRKFRIFWDFSEFKRKENEEMHSGIEGRTDIWQIIICDSLWQKKYKKDKSGAVDHFS